MEHKLDELIPLKRKPAEQVSQLGLKPVPQKVAAVEERGHRVGYGFEYTPGTVGDIIAASKSSDFDDVMSGERREFFQQPAPAERTSTHLPPSEQVYQGPWVLQGGEPTCLPWTMANATLALGQEPSPSYIADLLNQATEVEEASEAGGATYSVAQRLLQDHPEAGVKIDQLPYADRLRLTLEAEPGVNDQFVDMIEGHSPEDANEAIRQQALEAIKANGDLIQSTLAKGDILLTGVGTSRYAGIEAGNMHAVCIVGQRTSPSGEMDVQVVDPARGKVWMSLEHLSSSLYPYTYTLSRKANSPT
jgi:hypothetical protein